MGMDTFRVMKKMRLRRVLDCVSCPFVIDLAYGCLSTYMIYIAGYSFFDAGDVELLGQRKRSPHSDVGMSKKAFVNFFDKLMNCPGKVIPLAEY